MEGGRRKVCNEVIVEMTSLKDILLVIMYYLT